VRDAYDRLKAALIARYGPPSEFDYLKSGSIWREPREWVMAVKQKERRLVAFWSSDSGANLPSDVTGISLEVNAFRSDASYVDLTYEFANFPKCMARFSVADAEGL
jgi:hypothetical protein